MKTCDRIDSLVSAYLEHEASPAEIRFLDRHLTDCPRCRNQIHDVREALESVARLPRVQVHEDFTENVLVRTRGLRALDLESLEPWVLRPRTTRRVLRWGVPMAAAAALALALVNLQIANRDAQIETAEREAPPETDTTPTPIVVSEPRSTATVTPPEVLHLGEGEAKSLGMARDAYAVGTYELRTPTEGGTLILTPVAAQPDLPVVVTF